MIAIESFPVFPKRPVEKIQGKKSAAGFSDRESCRKPDLFEEPVQ